MENKLKLNYDDVTIIPEKISDISSRKECNCYDEHGYLPIFASCMSSVVSIDNIYDFNNNGIYVVIPRTFSLETRIHYLSNPNFVAFSLDETIDVFINHIPNILLNRKNIFNETFNICIDLANGHMYKLLNTVKEVKKKWGNSITIMTGNIANPETYRNYEEAGVDYARFSIGSGSCCSTSSNTSIHYPIFSLLEETYKIKKEINGKCKIIADGGIRGFRDIQKALIYADYVMIGGLFNKAIESAGKTTYGISFFNIKGHKIIRPIKTLLTYGRIVDLNKYNLVMDKIKNGTLDVWKECFGMSTKKAQQLTNEANGKTGKLKTSEGLVKHQKVEFDIHGWVENETDYLRSAMSYTNSKTLDEYKDSSWVQITQIKYNN